MQAVVVLARALHEVRAGQAVQEPSGLRLRGAGERGGGPAGELRPRVQAQTPEEAGGVVVQGPIGSRHHGAQITQLVLLGEGVQT
ncbi:hypothetical protein A9R04_10865 [Nocardiopsis dassonvillei]|nr:hypothetical protein A9R04_10865 [Nocardiopsis dassonvillei]